jgi:hypothetical protein
VTNFEKDEVMQKIDFSFNNVADGFKIHTNVKPVVVGPMNTDHQWKSSLTVQKGAQIVGLRFNSSISNEPKQTAFSWIQLLMHNKGTTFNELLGPEKVESVDSNYFAGLGKSEDVEEDMSALDEEQNDAMTETAITSEEGVKEARSGVAAIFKGLKHLYKSATNSEEGVKEANSDGAFVFIVKAI